MFISSYHVDFSPVTVHSPLLTHSLTVSVSVSVSHWFTDCLTLQSFMTTYSLLFLQLPQPISFYSLSCACVCLSLVGLLFEFAEHLTFTIHSSHSSHLFHFLVHFTYFIYSSIHFISSHFICFHFICFHFICFHFFICVAPSVIFHAVWDRNI